MSLWGVEIYGLDMDTTIIMVIAENKEDAIEKATLKYDDSYYSALPVEITEVDGYKILLTK